MIQRIRNPETGRLIDVGGVTYNKLVRAGKIKPGFGAEYYSGDACRCADCRKVGRPFSYPEICGGYEGIIGLDIEQYPGQIKGRRS